VITLADWYDRNSQDVGIATEGHNATLINGAGRTFPINPNANATNVPLAVVSVTKGKRYRFRVINMSSDPGYLFSIDQHNFTIIEADGENVVPHAVDALQIFAGQRYSLVFHADQPVGNYCQCSSPLFSRYISP
jgi:iron transport multicopper oxidase